MPCPTCQHNNPDAARFCLQCGTSLATTPTAIAEPERGTLVRALNAQYEIVRLLGRGGMGAVYLARERALDRAVAIKVLPPEMATDAASRERFLREARTAARLTHPNIVPLYSVGEAEGMLYFVMGYVRGESLADRMRRQGPLPSDDVRRIIGDLAVALDYAHRQGVIHRDIKPDNVLLEDESGRPMLTDFGVAKARASGSTLTELGAVLGTPHYMSPEQASGTRDLDGRSDLYSLGVMAYAMLSGRLPFDGDSFRDIVVQHMTKPAPPLRALVPDVPADLAAVVARSLAKDPGDRWPDGRAFAIAVGDIGDDDADTPQTKWSVQGSGLTIAAVWLGAAVLGILGTSMQFLRVVIHPEKTGPTWWFMALLLGSLATLPAGIVAMIERWRGDSWSAIIARIMLPPRGWALWWPKMWRRRGDVWDRLPRELRRVRLLIAASWPAFVVSGILVLISMDRYAHEIVPSPWIERTYMSGLAAGLASMFTGLGTFIRWSRRAGLSEQERDKVILAPNAQSEVWRKRKFAVLLSPAGGAPAGSVAAEPRGPEEFVRAIAERVGDLVSPTRELGAEAIGAARQLLAAMATLDTEIVMLARDAHPGELAQVEQKLADLGDSENDSPNRREFRQMLVNQRNLMQRLATQLVDATARRDRMLDMLRTLWLQVATLRADEMRDARADSEITGRIRAAIAEISAFDEAAATVRVASSG